MAPVFSLRCVQVSPSFARVLNLPCLHSEPSFLSLRRSADHVRVAGSSTGKARRNKVHIPCGRLRKSSEVHLNHARAHTIHHTTATNLEVPTLHESFGRLTGCRHTGLCRSRGTWHNPVGSAHEVQQPYRELDGCARRQGSCHLRLARGGTGGLSERALTETSIPFRLLAR
ncbi:hypothetical protein GY45DRAFT_1130790 [Cubamyces sp. BRFM 1775]|nr:hypothetical protein GY45DRAFT_1130790 [Cubamyces sp. BRFM 1775]